MPFRALRSSLDATSIPRLSRIFALIAVSVLYPMLAGCTVNVKGIMYLQKERVTRYIAEKKPTGKNALVKENYQDVLKEVPDGDRILGGFCTNDEIAKEISMLRNLTQQCHRKLQKYQRDGTHNGNVYVGLLGGTIGAGALTIMAGILGAAGVFGAPASASANIGGWLVLGFGVPTLALSLANSIGGFNYRYREYKRQAIRLDNMMWTMRLRLGVEVCNARNVDRARVKVGNIRRMMEMTCAENFNDDGTYRPR
ncbi:MAG: hypothetical protein H6728_08835 [Myxococcales bacterium]|nr:hypothetical protein [Myxococcales bacterium]